VFGWCLPKSQPSPCRKRAPADGKTPPFRRRGQAPQEPHGHAHQQVEEWAHVQPGPTQSSARNDWTSPFPNELDEESRDYQAH